MDWGLVVGVVGVIGIPAAIGLTMAATTPGEFRFVRGCFILAAILTLGSFMWLTYEQHGWPKIVYAGLIGAVVSIGLVIALDWVRTKQEAATPKDVPAVNARISVGCYQEILPKTLPADEPIQVLNLFLLPIENGGGGMSTQYNRSGQPWKWPVSDPMEASFLSAFRCEVTNYGTDPVLDLYMNLDLTFYESVRVPGQSENVRGHGNIKLHRPWPISIQTIDTGRENAFKFYIINNHRDMIVHVLMPTTATLRLLGDGQREQVNLTVTQLGGESPLILWPNFKPETPPETKQSP